MNARKSITLDGTLVMQRGSLTNPTLVYETWGKPNADKSNCVLIFTGLSPSAHAASSSLDPATGWWEDMIGPAKPSTRTATLSSA